MTTQVAKPKRLLAISSRGGHWTQLLRLSEAFDECDVTFVTTVPEYRSMIPRGEFYTVMEADRSTKLRLVGLLFQLFWLIITKQPHVIVSTGAAPGCLAIRIGKLIGAKTIWVDSIANAEQLSLSGRLTQKHADLVLTQWEHLAQDGGPQFWGAVI